MFRKFIRVSVAVLIPTFTTAILGGCTPTRGGGSAAIDPGGSQFTGEIDSEAWLPNAQTASNRESLPPAQTASSHSAYQRIHRDSCHKQFRRVVPLVI